MTRSPARRPRVEPADQGRRGLARSAAERCSHRRRIACLFFPLPDAEVILVGEADARVSVGRVLAVLRAAGRAEGTVRRQRVVLDRFAAFLARRGLDTASDRVCIDFIANQTGVRLGSLREPVSDRAVQAVEPPRSFRRLHPLRGRWSRGTSIGELPARAA